MGLLCKRIWYLLVAIANFTLGLVVGLTMIVVPMVSCQNALESDSKTHIQLATWGSAEELNVLKTQLAAFEAEHPTLKVDLLHIPDNYMQKLHILMAAGMAPDVMFINSLNYPVYADAGMFRDLSPYLKDPTTVADFFPQTLSAFQYRNSDGTCPLVGEVGKALSKSETACMGALPRDLSNLVVYVNTDLLKAKGLAMPPSNWSWEDALQLGKQLAKHPQANHQDEYGPSENNSVVYGWSFYQAPAIFWLPFVWSWGGELFDGQFNLQLDTEAAKAGLQFYANLRHQSGVAPKATEVGSTNMTQLFIQQRLAFLVSGRWSVPYLRQNATFQWDVLPMPRGPKGSKVGIDASGYAMAAKAKHPQAAWQLIQFLTSKQALNTVTASGLIVPARKSVAESAVFLSPREVPKHSQVFLDVIPTGVPSHFPANWNRVEEDLKLKLEPVWDGRKQVKDVF